MLLISSAAHGIVLCGRCVLLPHISTDFEPLTRTLLAGQKELTYHVWLACNALVQKAHCLSPEQDCTAS